MVEEVLGGQADCPKDGGIYCITFQDKADPTIKFAKTVVVKQQKIDGVKIPHNPDDACGQGIRKVMKEESITDIQEFHDKFKVLSIRLESSRD